MRYILTLLILFPTLLSVGVFQTCRKSHAPQIRVQVDPRQEKCLATMVYGEARGETISGKIAVAFSAINRKKRAKDKDICDIVLAPLQYSIFNDNAEFQKAATSFDIAPPVRNAIEEQAWQESMRVAKEVLREKYKDPTSGSTHYLAPVAMKKLGYKTPKWAKQYKQTGQIDNHIFFVPQYPKKAL